MKNYPVRLGATSTTVALISIFSILTVNPLVAETPAHDPSQQVRNRYSNKNKESDKNASDEASPQPDTLPQDAVINTVAEGSPLTVSASASSEKDDRTALPSVPASPSRPFVATAYSLRGRTASGRLVSRGLIAADRSLLPIGTRVRLDAGDYSGEYTVADTGSAVRGRKIDIWVSSTNEALRFGRRQVKLTVLKYDRARASKRK